MKKNYLKFTETRWFISLILITVLLVTVYFTSCDFLESCKVSSLVQQIVAYILVPFFVLFDFLLNKFNIRSYEVDMFFGGLILNLLYIYFLSTIIDILFFKKKQKNIQIKVKDTNNISFFFYNILLLPFIFISVGYSHYSFSRWVELCDSCSGKGYIWYNEFYFFFSYLFFAIAWILAAFQVNGINTLKRKKYFGLLMLVSLFIGITYSFFELPLSIIITLYSAVLLLVSWYNFRSVKIK